MIPKVEKAGSQETWLFAELAKWLWTGSCPYPGFSLSWPDHVWVLWSPVCELDRLVSLGRAGWPSRGAGPAHARTRQDHIPCFLFIFWLFHKPAQPKSQRWWSRHALGTVWWWGGWGWWRSRVWSLQLAMGLHLRTERAGYSPHRTLGPTRALWRRPNSTWSRHQREERMVGWVPPWKLTLSCFPANLFLLQPCRQFLAYYWGRAYKQGDGDEVGQDATAFLSTPPSPKLSFSLLTESPPPVSLNGRELLSAQVRWYASHLAFLHLLEQGTV